MTDGGKWPFRQNSSHISPALFLALEGASSIRTFQKEAFFTSKFHELVNRNTSVMLNFSAAQRWLGLRVEVLGATIVFVLSATIVCANGTFQIPPGVVGFVIQWGLVFSMALNYFFLRLSESEARITSVERVQETSQQLQQEGSWETDKSVINLEESWPRTGELVFEK